MILNFEWQNLCHLVLFFRKVASTPFPSSRCLKSIGIGSSFSSLKRVMFNERVEYPLPALTSRHFDSAGHCRISDVTSWYRRHLFQSIFINASFYGPGCCESTCSDIYWLSTIASLYSYRQMVTFETGDIRLTWKCRLVPTHLLINIV